MAKWVYMFTEGNANMRNLLGGKGANLARKCKMAKWVYMFTEGNANMRNPCWK